MKNISNSEYTRCANCGYIYEKNLKSCPKCKDSNANAVFEQAILNESVEPVFNIND